MGTLGVGRADWKEKKPIDPGLKSKEKSHYLRLLLVLVQLCQLVHGEVPLDLVFVHHSRGHGLLCNLRNGNQESTVFHLRENKEPSYLSVVDLLLHGSLGQEPVDVDGLLLPEAVHAED